MNTKSEKCLVIGADGFIGKHLVKELSSNGFAVRAFDRFKDYTLEATHSFTDLEDVEIFPGDFLNVDDLKKALEDAVYVFHLVSTTNPFISANNPYLDIDTNIRGSVELFDLCTQASNVKKVIYFSSGGTVYGEQTTPALHENLVLKPLSPYGIGKVTVENYLRYFKQTHGLDSIIYRIANPYGEGQNLLAKQGVIPIFLHHILHDEPIAVFGDGTMVRDYLYVSDVAKMIVQTFAQKNAHEVYNIGSGGGRTINELIDIMRDVTGKEIVVNHVDTPASFVHTSVLDSSRIEQELGARPEISLEEGIKKTWDYVQRVEA